MHPALLCCLLALSVTSVSSVTISTPPTQRKSIGENCQFRWKITGNFTAYTVKLLSSSSALGSNTNLNSSNGVITLLIWNIQTSDAGYYSLSINTGPSTDVTSIVLLFVYSNPNAYSTLSVGRTPSNAGATMELNCSATSYSLPVSERPKMYYFWNINSIGYLRNISSGPAVLLNGDVVPEYSIKNDGKTLVIVSAQYSDSFSCTVQEERSPYKSNNYNYLSITVYSKPRPSSFYPVSQILNVALYSYLQNMYFYYQTYSPLTSYTNWSFVNASGSIMEYSVGSNPLTSTYVPISSFYLNSNFQYGNYSITLTSIYGSTTTTFQVRPPGPPNTPQNFSVQYLTSSRISLQWRCMWSNGAQQTVAVRLTDAVTNTELETQYFRLDQNCYNSRYGTLFKPNIQPETSYDASIWSTNSFGSSSVVNLTLRTPKRLIFSVSPSDILIEEREATINFGVLDSTTALIRLNVTCCVEATAECSNKSYILSNTDNQILYDILPTGTEYVFDFNVFDTDLYTYECNLAIVKGVRVSTVPATEVTTPTTCIAYSRQCAFNGTIPVDSGNPLYVPVIVLAVLLGVAVLALLGCCIGFLVCKNRQNNSNQLTKTPRTSAPTRNNTGNSESSYVEDNYEPVVDVDQSKDNVYYKALGGTPGNAKRYSEALYEPGKEDDSKQNPYMNPNEIFHIKNPNGTLDRPKKNRYK